MRIKPFLLLLCLSLATASTASGQEFRQNTRSQSTIARFLGMGQAGVALRSPDAAFRYNPALLGGLEATKPAVFGGGVQMDITSNTWKTISYLANDLDPALGRGLDNASEEEKDDLRDRAAELANKGVFGSLPILLPTVVFPAGPVTLAVSAYSDTRADLYIQRDNPADDLYIDALLQSDFSIGVSGGYRTGDLNLGTTLRYVSRGVTVKQKFLDDFEETEPFYLLTDRGVTIDAGVQYFLDDLTIGAAVYDLAGTDLAGYSRKRNLRHDEIVQADLNTEIALADLRLVEPAFRVGATYETTLADELSGLFLLDFTGYGAEDVPAEVNLGAEVVYSEKYIFRAGANKGRPSVGLAAVLGSSELSYTVYQSRYDYGSDAPSNWHHAISLVYRRK